MISLFSQGQMTIFVNVQDSNEAPRFEEQDYNVTVNAKVSANQTLLQVKAIDVDSGENGQLSYRIQNDLTNQFLIDDKNGKLFVKSNVSFCFNFFHKTTIFRLIFCIAIDPMAKMFV